MAGLAHGRIKGVGVLIVHDLTNKKSWTLGKHKHDSYQSVAISPDGKLVAAGWTGEDGRGVKVWRLSGEAPK